MANPLFDQLFGRHAGKETPFLKMQGGEVISHADFLAMAARFSNVFQQLGLIAKTCGVVYSPVTGAALLTSTRPCPMNR